MDIAQIAATTVISLAPFMPYLLKATVIGGKKLVEVLAEKGGEVAWNKAQEIWGKIESKFGDDAGIKGAAMMISVNPTEKAIQELMIKALTAKLEANPDFAQDIFKIIGGENAVQTIITGEGSWAEKILLEMKGNGVQSLEIGKNAVGNGITMKKNS